MIATLFILALLGFSLGSFIGVCVYRIPLRLSVVTLSSFCPSCNRALRWHELIPVLSYFLSQTRCRSCLAKIPLEYLLAELLAAVIVVAVFLVDGISSSFLGHSFFLLVMLAVALIDWKHLVIPNKLVIGSLVL